MNRLFGRTPRKPSGGEQVAHTLRMRGMDRASLQARFSQPIFVERVKKQIGGTSQDVSAYLDFLELNDSPQFATLAKLALQLTPADHALLLDAQSARSPVSREEVARLLPAPSPIREKLLFLLLAEGISPADVGSIRRDDVNLRKGIIHIRSVKDGGVRDFPVPSKILPYLEFQTKCLAGPRSLLFSNKGRPLSEDDIRAIVTRVHMRTQHGRGYGN